MSNSIVAITRRTLMLSAVGIALALPGTLGVQAQELRQVTYVQPSPSAVNSFPVFVAIGEGYFEEEGLEVQAEAVNGSGAILQALSSGQAQFGRPGPAPVLQARSRDVDVVFLFNSLPRSSFGVLVQEESEYQTPEDLDGTVIGVGTADGAEVGFARAILADYGFAEPANYTFIAVGDGGTATAGFQRGDIKAYVGGVADAAILNYRGMAVRDITPEKFSTYFGNGYVAMRDFIDENPEVVEGFGRAMVRAIKFANDPANRETVLEHLAAGNPQEGEDPEFANALLEKVLEKSQPHDPSKGWGYQDPEHWATWHQSLIDTGELEAPMEDLEAAYTNEFVEAWNTPK